MNEYNAAQQSIASQFKMNYINLDDKISKTLDYYFDDCHFTDLGSLAVAENILPILIPVIDNVILKRAYKVQLGHLFSSLQTR